MRDEECVVAFDEALLGGAAPGRPPVVAVPRAASPDALYQRLISDLAFDEGPALLSAMERWNEDLFSCLPGNEDLYARLVMLSASADEVAAQVRAPTADASVDLGVPGAEPMPRVPAVEEELPAYVAAVERFFVSTLRAREERYARLLDAYCRAVLRYLHAQARRDEGKLRQLVRGRYYRDVARLARLLFLHLYVATARELSWRLHADQVVAQDVFMSLRYEWDQARQLTCLFHPVLFNHGVVLLSGAPVPAAQLRAVNHRRRELGLSLVRAGLIEEDGADLVEEPPFSATLPRAAGCLSHQVRIKMEAYSREYRDHTYCRPPSPVASYGSTAEALLPPPSPSAVLPCDPPPPARVSAAPLLTTVTLAEAEEDGALTTAAPAAAVATATVASPGPATPAYHLIPRDALNRMFEM
ncbi:transactivating tegument protein VP16 [Suid alphaherpesvirus 1]|uniref:Tegument protein VP16 homolog n=1 Tax=Suid herpesvirus 1 TaxID=10345 RepID=A0A172XDH2_SUHV|nr:transactivating tegument protein VP16 [Suid alphaherpesvirus 1]